MCGITEVTPKQLLVKCDIQNCKVSFVLQNIMKHFKIQTSSLPPREQIVFSWKPARC